MNNTNTSFGLVLNPDAIDFDSQLGVFIPDSNIPINHVDIPKFLVNRHVGNGLYIAPSDMNVSDIQYFLESCGFIHDTQLDEDTNVI